jgi:hypothetical protein
MLRKVAVKLDSITTSKNTQKKIKLIHSVQLLTK